MAESGKALVARHSVHFAIFGRIWLGPILLTAAAIRTGSGAPARTRTWNQLIKSQLLYQLSYRGNQLNTRRVHIACRTSQPTGSGRGQLQTTGIRKTKLPQKAPRLVEKGLSGGRSRKHPTALQSVRTATFYGREKEDGKSYRQSLARGTLIAGAPDTGIVDFGSGVAPPCVVQWDALYDLLAADRKSYFETGFAGVRFKFDFTPMPVGDDAVADNQAKAGAGADGLGGKKR